MPIMALCGYCLEECPLEEVMTCPGCEEACCPDCWHEHDCEGDPDSSLREAAMENGHE